MARVKTLGTSSSLSSGIFPILNSSLNRPLHAKFGKARMQARTSNSAMYNSEFKLSNSFLLFTFPFLYIFNHFKIIIIWCKNCVCKFKK